LSNINYPDIVINAHPDNVRPDRRQRAAVNVGYSALLFLLVCHMLLMSKINDDDDD